MIKRLLLKWALGHDPSAFDDDEETPRYPPFMKGLPAKPVDKLLESQAEMLGRVRQAVGAPRERYDEVYGSLIRRYAAYVHLLPASEGHHHRGSGGLLRHGLEVALLATQLADQVMWAMGEPPARRRELEPRWCCAVFVAALCHDVGKPLSDLKVVDQSGEHQWPAVKEPLIEWCERVGTKRYFLRWNQNRHQRHESLTPLLLPRLIPEATFDYINEGGEELYQQLVFAISSRDFAATDQEHNRIYKIVREADQQSTGKDISDPRMAGMPGALGVPLERYLMDAMRRMVREHKWTWNKPGARVWSMDGDVFVVWPAGADDIVKLLARDNAPGIPRHPDTLADILLERGLATPFDAGEGVVRTWPIQPDAIREKNPSVVLHALRLTRQVGMFDELPGQVDGRLGQALLEDADNAASDSEGATGDEPQNTPSESDEGNATSRADNKNEEFVENMDRLLTPQPKSAASQADNEQAEAADQPPPKASNQAGAKPAQSSPSSKRNDNKEKQAQNHAPAPSSRHKDVPPKPPRPAAADEAKAIEAHAWLAGQSHAGAIIAALAEDFRDGLKQWGQHGVRLPDGTVGIRHPDGWSGVGVAAKDMLPMLSEAGWVDIDPFQPMKKIREVDGFTGGKGASRRAAIVLIVEVSKRLNAIADSKRPAKANADATAQSEPADRAAATRKGKRKDESDTAATAPSVDEIIATLHEILELGKMGLPHRSRDGASICIPFYDAVSVLEQHYKISRSKSMRWLTDLRREGGDEIVIPVRGEKK